MNASKKQYNDNQNVLRGVLFIQKLRKRGK
nr:MAG TPA: hypothetical protein [Caudoviricetes sp.]